MQSNLASRSSANSSARPNSRQFGAGAQARRLGGFGGSNEPPFYRKKSASCEKGPLLQKGPLLWSTMHTINLYLRRTLINRAKYIASYRGRGRGSARSSLFCPICTCRVYCSNTMPGRKRNVFVLEHLTMCFFM